MSHSINIDSLTIIHTDDNGEDHDMNHGGEPCKSLTDLGQFIRELREVRAISVAAEQDLMLKLAEEAEVATDDLEAVAEQFIDGDFTAIRWS